MTKFVFATILNLSFTMDSMALENFSTSVVQEIDSLGDVKRVAARSFVSCSDHVMKCQQI
jgi:hypothetical protein